MKHSSDLPIVLKSLLFGALTCGLLLVWAKGAAQTPTVGTIISTSEAFGGYTLFPVTQSYETFLINNCGQEINRWTSEYKAGMMAYLQQDGSLIRAGRTSGPYFLAGGKGGVLERFDWGGNLIWSYGISDSVWCQHHDIEVLPNGNILALVWKSYPGADWIALGRDPQRTPQVVWGECILEIEPVGEGGGEVVWQWEVMDHLVQNFNSTLPNFGEPSMHPRRLNVNYHAEDDSDWIHLNSIDYNAELDHILVSSRNFNELWILDHGVPPDSTSTSAGDFIYRWGNPEAYDLGAADDCDLFGQHDARWIGNSQIIVFSNGVDRPQGNFSTVEIFTLPLNSQGAYDLAEGIPFAPDTVDWIYPEEFDADFWSISTSGAQPLPNGNVLITEGSSGEFREVTASHEVVWSYVNPVGAFGATVQGNSPLQNGVFIAEKYSASFPGLAGRDLQVGDVMEVSEFPISCELYPEETCAYDLDTDYFVGLNDLLGFLGEMGCWWSCQSDFDEDGAVTVSDLLMLLTAFGNPCIL